MHKLVRNFLEMHDATHFQKEMISKIGNELRMILMRDQGGNPYGRMGAEPHAQHRNVISSSFGPHDTIPHGHSSNACFHFAHFLGVSHPHNIQ